MNQRVNFLQVVCGWCGKPMTLDNCISMGLIEPSICLDCGRIKTKVEELNELFGVFIIFRDNHYQWSQHYADSGYSLEHIIVGVQNLLRMNGLKLGPVNQDKFTFWATIELLNPTPVVETTLTTSTMSSEVMGIMYPSKVNQLIELLETLGVESFHATLSFNPPVGVNWKKGDKTIDGLTEEVADELIRLHEAPDQPDPEVLGPYSPDIAQNVIESIERLRKGELRNITHEPL